MFILYMLNLYYRMKLNKYIHICFIDVKSYLKLNIFLFCKSFHLIPYYNSSL